MANFNMHLAVAAVGSGLCATIALAGHAAPNNYLLTLTLAGTIGGILPDIDLEKAVPSQMLFTGLGVVISFIVLFAFKQQYSIAELWIIWFGTFLVTRYGVFYLFHKRTHHRGIWHSLLAATFFMVLTAIIFDKIFDAPHATAWLTGFFVLIGFIIHLVLDEIYSVDIEGAKLKRSFGSALKIVDYKSWKASGLLLVAFIGLLFLAPPVQDFEEMIRAPVLFTFLKNKLLPKHGWFRQEIADPAAEAVEPPAVTVTIPAQPVSQPVSSATGLQQPTP